jgi:hypothetical protein
MRNIFLYMMIALFLSGCSTLKIDVDHDTSFAFNDKKTYAIVHSHRESDNTLLNDRIQNAIKNSLNAKDYKEVSKESASLIFVFHVNVTNRSDIRTDYQMIGYPGYRYGFGYGGYGYGPGTTMIATPSTYRWKEGRLVIDALNPITKKIVWRGTITDELSRSTTTTEEKTAYINKVVTKMMQKFPPK